MVEHYYISKVIHLQLLTVLSIYTHANMLLEKIIILSRFFCYLFGRPLLDFPFTFISAACTHIHEIYGQNTRKTPKWNQLNIIYEFSAEFGPAIHIKLDMFIWFGNCVEFLWGFLPHYFHHFRRKDVVVLDFFVFFSR